MTDGHADYGAVTGTEDEGRKTLEEVYTEIGLGPAQYLTWTALALVAVSDLSELAITALIIPMLRCEWGLGLLYEAVIGSSVFVAYAIGGVMFGSLSDKLGRRPIIVIGTVVLIIASLLSALSVNKWMYLSMRIIVGLCIGSNMPVAMVYSSEIATSRSKEHGPFIVTSATIAALFVISLLASVLLNSIGWRWFVVVVTIPAFFAVLLLLCVPESPRFLVASNQHDEAVQAVQTYYKWNGKEPPESLQLKTYNARRGSLADVFIPKYRKDVVLLTIMYSCNIFIQFTLVVYLPLALIDKVCGVTGGHFDVHRGCKTLSNAELFNLALVLFGGFFALVVGFFAAKKIGRVWSSRGFSFLTIIACASLLICISKTFSLVTYFVIKFSIVTSNLIIWYLVNECFPTVIRNTAVGFINFWAKSFGAAGTFMVYLIYSKIHVVIIISLVLFALLNVVATWMWDKETMDCDYQEVIEEPANND